MIAADASELQTRLAQTVIHIRNKEVMLFTDQFGVLAGTATFLASLVESEYFFIMCRSLSCFVILLRQQHQKIII